MKKTVVTLVLAFGLCISSLNATNVTSILDKGIETSIVEVSPLCIAVAVGDMDKVKMLIDNGIDVNTASNGMLPIHYAAKYNRVELIKVLITAGSEIHTPCEKGLTALKYAEKFNATDAAQFLKRFK